MSQVPVNRDEKNTNNADLLGDNILRVNRDLNTDQHELKLFSPTKLLSKTVITYTMLHIVLQLLIPSGKKQVFQFQSEKKKSF